MSKTKSILYLLIIIFLLITYASAQKKCMFIGADPDAGGKISENAKYDKHIMPLLQEWGYTVDKKHTCTEARKYTDKDFEPYDFIFLSETVHSSVMEPFRKIRKPMLCSDGFAGKRTSLGFTETAVGMYEPGKPIVFLESAKDHPLSAGYSPDGSVDLGSMQTKKECLVVWCKPTIPVIPIAHAQGQPDELVVYGIEKGTKNVFDEVINHRVSVVGTHAFCYPDHIIKEPTQKLMQAGIEWILDNSTKSQNNGIKPVNAAHSGLSHSTLNSLHSITFSIPSQSNVTLTVWNVFGQKIKTVINGVRNAGEHTVSLNASSMSTGMYVLKLEAGNTSYSQRVPFTN